MTDKPSKPLPHGLAKPLRPPIKVDDLVGQLGGYGAIELSRQAARSRRKAEQRVEPVKRSKR